MGSICIFGASSTWGAWDLELGGWVNRLRLWLDQKNVADDDFYLTVYCLGVDGDRTPDVLKRFAGEVAAREPDVIIISIGDNDAAGKKDGNDHSVSPDEFVTNITTLVDKAQQAAKTVIFLGLKIPDESKTNPVPWNNEVHYTVDGVRKYDELLRATVEQHGASYLPFADVLLAADYADGLHPNEGGHQKIFEHVRDFLQSEQIVQ